MFRTRKYLIAAAAVATVFTLSACADGGMSGMEMGGNTSTSAPSSDASTAGFNSADVTFAQMMIPHHEQAVEMSDVILAKDGIDAQVLELAAQIKDAQEPEIAQLNEWLGTWGASDDAMPGMDHGMDGMMSAEDMDALAAAEGVDASRLFLEQMVVHHQGAIDMAKTELADGENADALAMAEAIVSTQSDEIVVMQDILGSL